MNEIIQVTFNPGEYFTRTKAQWEYNKGQKLQINGVSLPQYFEGHFSNDLFGEAKRVMGENNIVDIPAEYFQPGKNIYCWVYIQDNSAKITVYQIVIPIHKRARPIDDEIDPEQESIIDQAITALNGAVTDAEAAADRAEAAAASIDEGAIGGLVEEYLDEHPVTVTELDPTVPEWAKQPTKPTYTPEEIGAADKVILLEGVATIGYQDSDYVYTVTTPPDLTGLTVDDFKNTVVKLYIVGDTEGYLLLYPVLTPTENTGVWLQWATVRTADCMVLQAFKVSSVYDWDANTTEWTLFTNHALSTIGTNRMLARLNMGGKQIYNLGAGRYDSDAVTLKQLNDALANVEIDVDDALSSESENPVQNKVVKAAIDSKGTYSKPNSGIPKADLSSEVKNSLDKANTALQSVPNTYRTASEQDAIDQNKLDESGDGSDVTVAFSVSASRSNVSTGEKLSVLLGKIAKWFSDLGSAAFKAATSTLSSGNTDLIESGAVYAGLSEKYSKPSGGIPKTDLVSAVQTSLGKADTALQTAVTSLNGQTGDVTLQLATDAQVQDAVDDYLDDHPTVTGTFTNEAKNALIALLEKVAYIDANGQTYLDTLETELFRVTVTSVSAVFTPGDAVFCTVDSLNDLKQYLVVTATYSDNTTAVVTTYTLSGTLTAGTSTITVSYGDKTDTFNVAVRSADRLFANTTWATFGGSGTISATDNVDVSVATSASTTSYTTGIADGGPTSSLKTYSQLANHRVRCYFTSNWSTSVDGARFLCANHFADTSSTSSTRLRHKNMVSIYADTEDGYADLIIPSDISEWNGTGTVSGSSYFGARNYFLASSGCTMSATMHYYDLGAES